MPIHRPFSEHKLLSFGWQSLATSVQWNKMCWEWLSDDKAKQHRMACVYTHIFFPLWTTFLQTCDAVSCCLSLYKPWYGHGFCLLSSCIYVFAFLSWSISNIGTFKRDIRHLQSCPEGGQFPICCSWWSVPCLYRRNHDAWQVWLWHLSACVSLSSACVLGWLLSRPLPWTLLLPLAVSECCSGATCVSLDSLSSEVQSHKLLLVVFQSQQVLVLRREYSSYWEKYACTLFRMNPRNQER